MTNSRQRIAAIIIQNNKILLVKDDRSDFFSIPGGGLEADEDQETALAREIQEEIGVTMNEVKYYDSFDQINQVYNIPQTDHAYLISINGTPVPSSEITELGWFSKDDIINKKVKVPPEFYNSLFKKLVEENLL